MHKMILLLVVLTPLYYLKRKEMETSTSSNSPISPLGVLRRYAATISKLASKKPISFKLTFYIIIAI